MTLFLKIHIAMDSEPEFWNCVCCSQSLLPCIGHDVLLLRRAAVICKPPLRDDDGSDAQFRKQVVDKYDVTPFHILLSAAKKR